jgi:hypothetical protein
MYGAKKKGGMPEKKKSPNKVIGAVAGMVGKALIGKAVSKAMDKKNSPNTKKKTPMKMVKSMGSAGMVGKAGTAKPPGGPKGTKSTTANKTAAKKQGYNARLDESLGARNGKKTQSLKARRDESKGAEKSMGIKSYSGNKSSAQGKRVARKR